MAVSKLDSPVYTDLSGLSQLKRAAGRNDPATIRKVAQQFESMFTRMMLKSMRDAVGKDPMFGSDQQQMYEGMADDQLAIELSKGRGLGLADMLVRQLQKMGVQGAAAATAIKAGKATGSTGSAGAAGAAAYKATQRVNSNAAAVTDADRTSFVLDLWPHAQQAGQRLGIDPRNLIAQAALETNWGQCLPQGAGGSSNNLFGIKSSADWNGASVTGQTQEFQEGVAASTSARFRAYTSRAQSFADYVALLRDNPRYSAALNTGSDVGAFATALQRGGYATDPDYASKISALAHKVNGALHGASLPQVGANRADTLHDRRASGVIDG